MFGALRSFRGRTRLWALAASIGALGALAAPGDVDPTFGSAGQTIVRYGKSSKDAAGLVVQPDGKFVVAMLNNGFQASHGAVLRFNADRTLDTSFGDQGSVFGMFGDAPTALAMNSTGEFVVALNSGPSATANANGVQYTVVRLAMVNASGMLDSSFGSAGFTAAVDGTTGTDSSGLQQFNSVAIAPDGKIVAAGYTTVAGNIQHVLVARFNTNGTLDTTFATTGYASYSIVQPGKASSAYGMVVQADGKIVIAGTESTYGFVARILADGSALDTPFGGGSGYAAIVQGSGVDCRALTVVSARFVVGCSLNTTASNADLYVTALTSGGIFDGTFASVVVDTGGNSDSVHSLTSAADGRIYAIGQGGATTARMAILALGANGGLDPSFNSGNVYVMPETDVSIGEAIAMSGSTIIAAGAHGITSPTGDLLLSTFSTAGTRTSLTYANPTSSMGYFRLIITPDGGFVAGGSAGEFANPYMMASKFTAAGALDSSFGIGGHSRLLMPNMSEGVDVRDQVVQADGKVLVVGDFGGWNLSALRVGVGRLGTDGNADSTFNTPQGYNYVQQGSGLAFTRGVRLQSDGKSIAVGSLNNGIKQIAAVRFNTDGSLDTGYGTGGIAFSTFPNATSARHLDLDANGRVIAVANSNANTIRVARFTTSGALDASFGASGMVSIPVPAGLTLQLPTNIIALPNGKMMIVSLLAGEGDVWAGSRLNADGSLDTSYGTNGFALISQPDWGAGATDPFDASVTPNGRLLMAGIADNASLTAPRSVVARLNPNGSPDLSFGTNGIHLYSSASPIQVAGVDIYANGAMVLSGNTYVGHERRGWVTKTVADPSAVALFRPETDLDGNTTADLLWQNSADGSVQGWLMSGLTATQTAGMLPAGGYVVTHVADLDGDGRGDLLIKNTADGSVVAWLMNGLSVSASSTLAPAGSGWSIAKTADLDGDGKADLIWQHTDGTVQAWLMNGLTVKSVATFAGAGSGWSVSQVGDFDGDGKTDLFWQHADGSTQAWLMNGLTVTSVASYTPAATGWSVVMVGDFNGDGKTDLFWQHTNGATQAWLMNGLGVTGLASFTPAATGWSPKLAGDIDGDGKADIFWEHTNGASQTWLMNGLSVTSLASFVPAGTGWTAQHLFDFNGDGKKDVVWQHTNGGVQAWLMNGLTITQIGSLAGAGTYNIVP